MPSDERRARQLAAEAVMETLREPQLRKVVSFEDETCTHFLVRLTCNHGMILPICLSPAGMKKFLLEATVDCRECAP